MKPLDTEFTPLKNNPTGGSKRLRGKGLETPNYLIRFTQFIQFTLIITHMKRLHNCRPFTTGLIDLTLLPWTKRRSLTVDMQTSLSDRIAEIGGRHHV